MLGFDYVVIGSGSGLPLANKLAEDGFDVAVIEKERPGGTCLNTGCIPSKLLINSADLVQQIQKAKKFGIQVHDIVIDYPKILQRTNHFTNSRSSNLFKVLSDQQNPAFFNDEAKFVGRKTLQIGEQKIKAKNIIIASGSRPNIPQIEGLDKISFLTSDSAMELTKKPEILTIIGGGYIGCELAHFFGMMGSKINIIHSHDLLLNHEDEDVAEKFTEMISQRYNVFLNYRTTKICKKNGQYLVTAHSNTDDVLEISSDNVLLAVGRIPNTDSMGLNNTDVELDDKGHIIVNEILESTNKGIFALGDVIKNQPFKHAANYEANCLYNTLSGCRTPVDYTKMPRAIFTSPQIASVGKTEQSLRSSKIKYKKLLVPFEKSAMGAIIDNHDGFVKLLLDENKEKILGAHILGPHASILIHEIIVAMNAPNPIDVLKKSIHIHPSLSETVSKTIGMI